MIGAVTCLLIMGIVSHAVAWQEGTQVVSGQEGMQVVAGQKDTQFVVGVGIVISPDYRDLLEAAYPNADLWGGYGWLDLHLGLRFNANENFSITPQLGFLFNLVSIDYYYFDYYDTWHEEDSYFNTIIVPSISARYAFNKAPSLYLRAEVNYNIPNTGSDAYDFSSGGVGVGGMVGYEFKGGWHLEGGYTYIPVDVEWWGGKEDRNIGGGFTVRFGKAF